MRYISTRGDKNEVSFVDALLTGLAPDGGLYMPVTWPQLADGWKARLKDAPYTDCALEVTRAFAGDDFSDDELQDLVQATYALFADPDVAPLRELEPNLLLLELFHGPTFAFKDFAMQMLGHLFDASLKKRDERRTIVVATSGDTGAAAVEALGGLECIDLFVMHPEGRISDAQRRQMTTSLEANVYNIAVQGTFDDCQRILKTLFADDEFRNSVSLGAVNSINWARIMAQTAYFISTAAKLDSPAAYSVPTGNFGDIFAGFVARKMGVETGPLVIATNKNDILHRTLMTGIYKIESSAATLSPAMDIQVASNFERLLFEVLDRDAELLGDMMNDLASKGEMRIPASAIATMRETFLSDHVDDDETREEIRATFNSTSVMVDPHTAVGLRAARQQLTDYDGPRVVLSTAHPAKFADTVEAATGKAPDMPARLADMMDAPERLTTLLPDANVIKGFIASLL